MKYEIFGEACRVTRIIAAGLMLLMLLSAEAFAAPSGKITHTSGPIMVKKPDGSVKALSIGSSIDAGDVVMTQKRTYARIKFSDGSEVTLKPNTQFKVDRYAYDTAKPKDDTASFSLVKGGLRTITGQIGKRGNQDSYRMKTPTATIGIRGTIYEAHFCQGSDCGEKVDPGLYVAVKDGTIVFVDENNNTVIIEVKKDQYVYMKDAGSVPKVSDVKPPVSDIPQFDSDSGACQM